ncbi:MAG: cobalamin-binding protein [Planctomycetaceae bacterium]
MPEPRIISLIASATEIVCALGFRDQLVGRSHECDYPPDVDLLPVCSESRVDVHASSREIDRQVKVAVAEALSVYRVKVDELKRLRPTHIITQTQCEVCAVSLRDVERAVCEMVGSQPEIVSLEPMCLADVWKDIHKVAAALDAVPAGDQLVAQLQGRLDSVRQSVAGRIETPTVLCLEWIDPLMVGGNWMPELVTIAGGHAVLATAGVHSPWISWEDLQHVDPDVIVVLPCGFDIPRSLAELAAITDAPRWQSLRAVESKRVYVTDGNQYFNRPGPRVVESAEILADVIHRPDTATRHRGTGWIPLPGSR